MAENIVTRRRKYPVGIQTFSEIIKKGYVYVDKAVKEWVIKYSNKKQANETT